MNYDYILIRYGEIALKGKNRKFFEDKLVQNIKKVYEDLSAIRVTKTFGRVYVELNGVDSDLVIGRLKNVVGIVSFSPVKKTDLELDNIKELALNLLLQEKELPKTFKVDVKRAKKDYYLNSPEITMELGAHILKNTEGMTVDVHNPETTVRVEVRIEGSFIYSEVIKGIGGLPGGVSGKGLVLLSGGIDSPVATFLAMKRGLLVEAIHFHTHPITSEESLEKVINLAKLIANFSGEFTVHFVPFLEVQSEIRKFAPESYNITIMRRMFIRIAEQLAENRRALALVTGESLGQVASQTLESMNTISNVANIPIIRPCVTMDKTEIIEIAKKIGTFEESIRPFEDCCSLFVPQNPATKPKIDVAEKAEKYMAIEDLIDEAIENTKVIKISSDSNISVKNLF